MTGAEFVNVINHIESAGILIADTPRNRLARIGLYFDSLKDLPCEAVTEAARRLAAGGDQVCFPTVKALRDLAEGIIKKETANGPRVD